MLCHPHSVNTWVSVSVAVVLAVLTTLYLAYRRSRRGVPSPNLEAINKVVAFLLPNAVGAAIALVAAEVALAPTATHTAVIVSSVVGFASMVGGLAMTPAIKKRLLKDLLVPPVEFPPPPPLEWDQKERKHGRSTVLMYGVLPAALTWMWLGVLSLLFGSLGAIWSPSLGRHMANVASAVLLIAGVGILIPLLLSTARPLARAGREQWRAALNQVVSPALARSAELISLANGLRNQAMSTAQLVEDIDRLSRALHEDLKSKQAEHTELLKRYQETHLARAADSAEVDALFAEWTERSEVSERRRGRRDRLFQIAVAVVGLILGYLLATFVHAATTSQLFGH